MSFEVVHSRNSFATTTDILLCLHMGLHMTLQIFCPAEGFSAGMASVGARHVLRFFVSPAHDLATKPKVNNLKLQLTQDHGND